MNLHEGEKKSDQMFELKAGVLSSPLFVIVVDDFTESQEKN